MITCPFCSAENIEGADTCEACGHSLSELHLPAPANEVEQALLQDRVADLKPKAPVSVSADKTLGDTLHELVEKSIGCVLVVEEEKLVGIFSERDALMRVGGNAAEWADRPIRDFMTPKPQALQADAKVAFAVHSMDLGGYRHVPIVNGDGVAEGIVSVRDILGFLSQKMAGEA